jgi:tryptophan synthase alpha chain
MSEIAAAFDKAKAEKRAAFIPYLTAGDPDLETTGQLLFALARAGADIIELGVPFSDPIADGPVNQRAATRALASGTTLTGVLELVSRLREGLAVPIVLFTYFNPLHVRGLDRFAEQASASGVDGVLCVDLPPEEAIAEYLPALRRHRLDTPFLLAPTSDKKRIAAVDKASTGFVYYVSRTGVTGAQGELPKTLLKEAKRMRQRVSHPLAVGFGISNPEQARVVGKVSDGVVVGSALVSIVEVLARSETLVPKMEYEAQRLVAALSS